MRTNTPKQKQAKIEHYENFPVASFLCPANLRAPITAIYHFARTADDIADEGNDSFEQRIKDLNDYKKELDKAARGQEASERWQHIFIPLSQQIKERQLPTKYLDDLLKAFIQDTHFTEKGRAYQNWDELKRYCSLSANPVGRLLLHLYGVDDEKSKEQSDDICTALQLINFWQDISQDIPRGRYYLPISECAKHGITIQNPKTDFAKIKNDEKTAQLIKDSSLKTRWLMLRGAPLCKTLKGRIGLELKAVISGALCVLEKTEKLGANAINTRPKLKKTDIIKILSLMSKI